MSKVAEMGTAVLSSGHSEKAASPQASYGILVFSHSLQLQYVNRRALDLIRYLGQTMTRAGSVVLSPQVVELRDLIRERLNDRLDADIREPFEVCRVVTERKAQILLRGIGCPDQAAGQYSRIILVLEEIRPEDSAHRVNARIKASRRQATCAGLAVNS